MFTIKLYKRKTKDCLVLQPYESLTLELDGFSLIIHNHNISKRGIRILHKKG
jgi:hypothetical protein